MAWNYRVLRHPDGHLGLHEVYYDKAGKPISYTAKAILFAVDEDEGLPGLTASLELALRDAKERPILDVSEIQCLRRRVGPTEEADEAWQTRRAAGAAKR